MADVYVHSPLSSSDSEDAPALDAGAESDSEGLSSSSSEGGGRYGRRAPFRDAQEDAAATAATTPTADGFERIEEDTVASRLRAERDALHARLLEASAANAALRRDNSRLSEEAVELSKALFEEANTLVADERRRRADAEGALAAAVREAAALRDALSLERMQLAELRQRLHDAGGAPAPDLASSLPDEDLLAPPRLEASLSPGDVDAQCYASFCALASAARPDADARFLLAQPYVRGVHEADVLPLLRLFECVPSSFHRALVHALLNNTASVERAPVLEGVSRVPSLGPYSGHEDAEALSASSGHRAALSLDGYSDAPERPQSELGALGSLFRRTLATFHAGSRSLPDPHADGLPDTPARLCALCGRALPANQMSFDADDSESFRLRLADDGAWLPIDAACRLRIVALAHHCTFVRHVARGLHARRPAPALFLDALALRRRMFYARLGPGAAALFRRADWAAAVAAFEASPP